MNRFKKILINFCISFLKKNEFTFYEKNPLEDDFNLLYGGIQYPCLVIKRIKHYKLLRDLEHILDIIDDKYKKGISFTKDKNDEHYLWKLGYLTRHFGIDLKALLDLRVPCTYCEISINQYEKDHIEYQSTRNYEIQKLENVLEELKHGS